MANAFLFLLLLIFYSNITIENIHACNQSERSSLLSFALTLSSPQLNWTSADCCNWEGVTCNQGGWITHLQLPSKGLKLKEGTFLSSSLGNLRHLTHLNLSYNSFFGSLDQTEFFLSLNDLEILDLSFNLLFGVLPSSLPSSHIRMVDLSSNRLHGAVPSSFFQQAWNLTSFNVSNNTFSGPIPSSICRSFSSSLRHLDFSFNNFTGSISSGLGKCSKLQVFRAGHNYLSGSLPEDMFNSTTLEEISLPLNSLNGAMSDGIANLTNLTTLDLSYNQLSGVLPLHLEKLSKLKYILLDFNYLEGSLPLSLMNCTNLVELRMGNNSLGGDISMLNFSKLSQLSKLDLRKNNFFGILPRSIYSCKFLKAIRLNYNNLEVQIHPEILSLKYLSFLSLGCNKRLTDVTGSIKILMGCKRLAYLSLASSFLGEEMPNGVEMADFHGFRYLQILDLNSCNLSGIIPSWLSKLKKLQILDLEHNRITGSIPSWLGTLPRLNSLMMQFNLLSGEIPKELCTLPMLVSGQTAAQVGRIYLELPIYYSPSGHAKLLQYNYIFYTPFIHLGHNCPSGNIPIEIGQLQLLHQLDLSANNFSGNIPDQISNLKYMEILDLSMNHLSGKIPASFRGLNFLSRFNVSYNNLRGPIPSSTQLQSFNASAFEGNLKLCGAPLPNKCQRTTGADAPDMSPQDADTKEHQIPWFYVSVALGFITGFWGVCGPLVLVRK
ncbi:putative leucine-rich repeat-containing, plant-type, leucine-rich repeat domain, L [Rosa chinensis]|uniref:Putative leucine-rich repeat-containing, plant-type, leucine-rich repeat domain, L n=1 Tax=Rosa chinensis TaxID=74649 RepID=A0A2P6QN64_ROSCH|nr:putative leucine-rich repeat-containing, plant-type, leucine-rich repeat domain, L [Rosa chinensis]